jgi:hypothetical protein
MSHPAARYFCGWLLALWIAGPAVASAQAWDTITFGNTASENTHSFSNYFTQVVTGLQGQTARQCTIALPTNIYGGNLTFTLAVDPQRRNYFSIKLSGDEDGSSGINGCLYLYIPAAQYLAGSTNNYQIGFRHEGDYITLSSDAGHPPLPGRFFYSTTLLPLWMTQARTNLVFKIVSTGRIYDLGSGDQNSGGNYQFDMSTNSRSIFSAYTHTDPFLPVAGEVQGTAPPATTRPSPDESILNPGGTFQSGVNSYVNVILGTTLTNLTTSEIEALALAYSISNLPAAYQQPAVVAKVMAGIDSFGTNYYANPSGSVSSGGGNESWGGRFGPLGHAISLLLPQLQGSLGLTNNYGGGNMSRGQAWGQMLAASRDYGRFNRDGHAISNQGMIADQNIFMANMGLLALGNTNAFTEAAAERYLREAVGLSPWLGSDLPGGGSSWLHGTNYFMVTTKGLTREWGYVGNDYGEIAYYAANFYQYTTNSIFRDQATKMLKARAPFRRPGIEISGARYYHDMESIGLLAWRGADESDTWYADAMAYGDRCEWSDALRVAAVTLDTNAVGYAKQMLADNQYFSQLIADPRYYSGGSLAANSFDGRNVMDVFSDYFAVSNAPDSGIRLPMTDGQPDFAWADEEDGIVAIKHGSERLWIAPYWQAKLGINGLARFHYSTTNYEQYGVLETIPQFNFSGAYITRPAYMDNQVANFYVPYDKPINAYAGERLPVGMVPPLASDNGPFCGKAAFYAFRLGHYLVGMNANPAQSYELKVPPDFAGGSNLITGLAVNLPVMVGPGSTVVLYLGNVTNSDLVPLPPLFLNAVGDSTPRISLDWNAASGATGYLVKRATVSGGPYTNIALVSGTNYADLGVARGTAYYYVVSGTNSFGESDYNSMEATTSAGLPLPWFDTDVGAVETIGGASYQAGTFTVKGAGSDIGGTADACNFAYLNLTNDGAITARLAAEQVSGSGLDKVGLMMRETTNANSRVQGLVLDLQTSSARFPARLSTGSSMQWQQISGTFGPPLWFKLARTNNIFTGYVSTDDMNWTVVGQNTIAMTTNYLVGLAVCSRTTAELNSSVFDNLTTPAWSSPAPTMPAGLAATAGDGQVVLTWNASTNAAAYQVYRSLTNGAAYAPIAEVDNTTLTDEGLANGTLYYYFVASVNPVGESAASTPVSVRPLSSSPAAISVGMDNGQWELSWPPDHTGWWLEAQTNSLSTGLGTNWLMVPGSAATNQMPIVIDPGNGDVFFRLAHP